MSTVPLDLPTCSPSNIAYTVGWVCAISTEYLAAQLCLDEEHDRPEYVSPNDNNDYTLGRVGKHNVVIAVLPDGEYGTSSAASVARDMLHSFPNVRIGLMVGIGGGAPNPSYDVRLGDIVVSTPREREGGVLQYDFGKTIQDQGFRQTGSLNRPPTVLLTAVNGLKTQYRKNRQQLEAAINFLLLDQEEDLRQELSRPHASSDRLYRSDFVHPPGKTNGCMEACCPHSSNLIQRPERRRPQTPVVHHGLIASANQLMKNALVRDQLSVEKGVLCFDMEVAGLMNHFPCLVIRGICDYADSHKNKEWQGYAAMAAAAYARDLLYRITPNRIEAETKIGDILSGLHDIRSTMQDQTKQQEIKYQDDKDKQCLKDLFVTDPHMDKQRIQDTKGGLFRDSYRWVLDHPDFKQFRDDPQSRMLWIKGDPGKGKTMLLCGIVDELEKVSNSILSYFFCQATETRLNSAVSVLRGLIYMLLIRQPSLIRHVRAEYDLVGEKLFQGINVWVSLIKILTNMLTDSTLRDAILIVDALDECVTARSKLLDYIIQSTSTSLSGVKWIVSSRNWPEIERRLARAEKVRLHLELNKDSISKAVEAYIGYKVGQLARDKEYDEDTRNAVQNHLIASADGTFLWAALVCQQLGRPEVARRHALSKVKAFPPGLNSLYGRMMQQIYDSEDAERCKEVLAIASVVYEPIHLEELKSLMKSPDYLQQGDLEEIIASCGSFLTLLKNVVYFVHQSAKDYLSEKASHQILPNGIAQQHHAIFLNSLEALSGTLRRDIYCLGALGFPIDLVSPPHPDPLASIRYSCIYWVDHFEDSKRTQGDKEEDLGDFNAIYDIIQMKFLYWLESLSLLHSLSKGVLAVQKLQNIACTNNTQYLLELLRDARRFLLSHKPAIEIAPLQVYGSALIFSPCSSIVRGLYKEEEPDWMMLKPIMESDWNACLQTLEGHTSWVSSVVFSPDSPRLASGSHDRTIKLWDAATGACVQTLKGHTLWVSSVVFSPDGQRLASGSADCTIKIWYTATGACVQTLEGHSNFVRSVVFSRDGQQLASGSDDGTVRLWDGTTGTCMQTLEGHSLPVTSVVFSPDSPRLASGSHDRTIKLWDAATGACVQTLKGHTLWVSSVVFSPDGQRLASGSADCTIKIWYTATGACMQTLEGHSNFVRSVVFSRDGQQLASGSDDGTVRLWDGTTGECMQTFKGHGYAVSSVVFSPDDQRLASGSHDHTIKLWDAATGACTQTPDGYSDRVNSVVFSPDGQRLASGSNDCTIKIWDTATGACVQTFDGHEESVRAVVFSPDSLQLASGSDDRTIKVWDAAKAEVMQTLEGHSSSVYSVLFSPDGQLLLSGSDDCTMKAWDATTGTCVQTFKGHSSSVYSVAFSPDGLGIASGSDDRTIKVWDVATGAHLHTLKGHGLSVSSVVFSPNGHRLASASHDNTIKIWDASTGACVQTFKIGRVVAHLSFNPTNTSQLCTDIGSLNLDRCQGMDSQLIEAGCWGVHNSGCGISPDGIWIVKDGCSVLWTPPEYRAFAFAAMETTIAIGCYSGRVLVMKLSLDKRG